MTAQLDLFYRGEPWPRCTEPGCDAPSVICQSCINQLAWPCFIRDWSRVPRVCTPMTCRMCQCPEYEPIMCSRHAVARLAILFG